MREVFDPAHSDLRIAYLDARQRTRSRLARAGLGVLYAARVLLLVLDCWRVVLAATLAFHRSYPPGERHPQEPFTMLLYYARHALRLLVREPGFTMAALLTLALGVGANVAVFALVEAVLVRPLPYVDADRLAIVKYRDQRTGLTKQDVAMGDFVDLAARQSVFESMAGYGSGQGLVFGFGDPFRVSTLGAGPGLLDTLGIRPVLGRLLQPDDSRPGTAPVVVLGYELWQRRFGSDPNIVGRGVKLGSRERQVVGVAPEGFRFPPAATVDVIVPMTVPATAPAERKSGWWPYAVARLKPGTSIENANVNLATLSTALQHEYPRSNQASEYFTLPLRDAVVGDTKPALLLLLAAVGVVLLIACANVANLMVARSLARRREMAVRMALGAGRAQLVAQLLAESLMLALAAGCAGALVAMWGVRGLVALLPASVAAPGLADVRIDGRVLAFTLGVSVATALLFGLVAALTVKRESAAGALVATGRVTMSRTARRATSTLVVVEIALAIVLLVGAGLILRSFVRLLAVDPGFRADRVMTMGVAVPPDRYKDADSRRGFHDRVTAALRALPDVRDVGTAVVMPLTGNNWTVAFERVEQPVSAGARPPEVGWQVASGGYFRALQIPLVAGRLFDESDTPHTRPVVIISEAVQRRFFPHESVIGRLIQSDEGPAEIVGVVGNIRRADLRDEPRADLYFPDERGPGNQTTLFVRTSSDPAGVLPSLQTALRAIEPNIAFLEPRTLSDVAAASMQVTQLALWLLGLFAVISISLAAVGIYGVMSYVVRQRTREIGTRVALGATGADIAWLVMRQGAAIASLGTALGLAASLVASRSLAAILFGVSTSDPATLAVSAGALIGATAAACYGPARQAVRVDPARTLADQ
jgi:putative ABC transport system permease protein